MVQRRIPLEILSKAGNSVVFESKRNVLSNQSSGGFTLIELLAVISIISLLLAIMLPAVSAARRVGRRMVCQSNLRQIAMAWQAYLSDNKGAFYQGINANILYGGWKGIYFPDHPRPLNDYLGLPKIPQSESEARVFRCPDDKGFAYSKVGTSYQTNILLIGQDQVGKLPGGELSSRINMRLKNLNCVSVDKSQMLLLVGDYSWGSQWIPEYPFGPPWHRRCCHYNLAFLDCHVDFLHIHKGLYITDEYTVLPFRDLYKLAREVQVKEPCPSCE